MKATVPKRNTTDLLNVENKVGQGLLLCLLTENKALVMFWLQARLGIRFITELGLCIATSESDC